MKADRLIVALDLPSAAEALAMAARLRGHVSWFKVGSQLFTAAGPNLVSALVAARSHVFLDLKFHDIPNTVAAAVTSAGRLGASLIDVHALGGSDMIRAAAQAARGLPEPRPRLLAITVLTSHDEASLERLGIAGGLEGSVRRLALLAQEAGADGVVASPLEAPAIRGACGPGFLVVTPGIRPAGAPRGDQARHATPAAALRAGADFLVMGRPVLDADDPVAAVEAAIEEMSAASR